MSQRRVAIISGISLILMGVVGGYSVGYAFPEFYATVYTDSAKDNLLNNQGLYKIMLVGILLTIILDLLVSYTLYKYFERDNNKLSLISGIIRLVYTVIFGIAAYFLTINLNADELTNSMVNANFYRFQFIWNSGLTIFGFHVFLLGVLSKIHKYVPRVLWWITLIAGVAYIVLSPLKVAYPNAEMVSNLEMILALPMAIGELGLAVWLLIKGGKQQQMNEISH